MKTKIRLYIDVNERIKECGYCHNIKSFEEFHTHMKRKGHVSYGCKDCKSIEDKKYRKENPDAIFSIHLKKYYSITVDQYMDLFLKQNGKCAICLSETSGNKIGEERLHIDHIEVSNKKIVRGLLCTQCNTALGKFKDDIFLLEKAIEYLKKSKELIS